MTNNARRIKAIDAELRRIDQGSDVAYDMAMNDGGFAVRRLEKQRAQLLAEKIRLQNLNGLR